MDARALLEEVLQSSRSMADKGRGLAEEKLGVPEQGGERDAMLSGLGKGALAGGALALLLGTGVGRGLTGTALKLGSVAAIGGIAWKAWQQWQTQQQDVSADPGVPVDQLEDTQAQGRSMTLLKAMVAAAKADGHIDYRERQAIDQAFAKLGLDADTQSFFKAELDKPLNAEDVAALADSRETAAEIYLASLIVINTQNEQERAYLDKLAQAMDLPAELVAQLEAQAAA